jgi:hypothetical protein
LGILANRKYDRRNGDSQRSDRQDITSTHNDPVKPNIEIVACLKYLGRKNLKKYWEKSGDNCHTFGSFSLRAKLDSDELTLPASTNWLALPA